MKKISIVTICYNEEGNIREYYEEVVKIFKSLADRYTYEIIIADNASTDRTQQILREIAAQDKNFKVILNARNFGVNRSGNNAFMQADGDAVVLMVSDLQDPPALIPEFIEKWEQGYKVVMAVKNQSKESRVLYFLRSLYYVALEKMSDVKLIQHFTGFGLYDQQILEIYKTLNDPHPYFRGLISDIGFTPAIVYFTQPQRRHGRICFGHAAVLVACNCRHGVLPSFLKQGRTHHSRPERFLAHGSQAFDPPGRPVCNASGFESLPQRVAAASRRCRQYVHRPVLIAFRKCKGPAVAGWPCNNQRRVACYLIGSARGSSRLNL